MKIWSKKTGKRIIAGILCLMMAVTMFGADVTMVKAEGEAATTIDVKQKIGNTDVGSVEIPLTVSFKTEQNGTDIGADTEINLSDSYWIQYDLDFKNYASTNSDFPKVGDKIVFRIPTSLSGSWPEGNATNGGVTIKTTVDQSSATNGYYTATAEITAVEDDGKNWGKTYTYATTAKVNADVVNNQISNWDGGNGIISIDVGDGTNRSAKYNPSITPSLLTSKSGTVDSIDSNNEATITWTAEVQPKIEESYTGAYFHEVVLTDVIPENETFVTDSVTVKKGNDALNGTDGVTYDATAKTLKINLSKYTDATNDRMEAKSSPDTYTITFQTKVPATSWDSATAESDFTQVSEKNTITADYKYKKNLTDTDLTAAAQEEATGTAEQKADTGSLLEKLQDTSASPSNGYVAWKINVNNGGKITTIPDSGIVVTDTLPSQTIVSDSNASDYKKYLNEFKVLADTEDITNAVGTITVDDKTSPMTFTFTIPKEKANGKTVTITYQTKYDRDYSSESNAGNANGVKLTNKVKIGIGPGYTLTKSGEITVASGALIKKSYDSSDANKYTPATHTFTWDVYVSNYYVGNDDSANVLGDFTVSDQIPEGTELVDVSLATKGKDDSNYTVKTDYKSPSNSDVDSNRNVTLFTESNVTDATDYKFTVKTRFTDAQIEKWAANNVSGSVKNYATLKSGEGTVLKGKSYTVSADATYSSQMITKEWVDGDSTYDSNHTIKWKVTVNQNKLTVTDGTTTDTLPKGLIYKEGSLTGDGTVFKSGDSGNISIATSGTADSGQKLTVTLPASFSGEGYYTYETYIDTTSTAGKALLKEPTAKLVNPVQLSGNVPNNKADGTLTIPSAKCQSSATATVTSAVVTKSAKKEGAYVNYTVVFNKNQATIANAKLVDTLPTGVYFLKDTLKVQEVTVDANGTTTVKSDGATLTPKVNYVNNTVTISLGTVDKAYQIDYQVVIMKDGTDTSAVNKIALYEGNTALQSVDSNAHNVQYSAAYSETSALYADAYKSVTDGKAEGDPIDTDDSGNNKPGTSGGSTGDNTSGVSGNVTTNTTTGTVATNTTPTTATGVLPQTGGFMGTIVSYLVGAGFIAAGLVILFHRKRSERHE